MTGWASEAVGSRGGRNTDFGMPFFGIFVFVFIIVIVFFYPGKALTVLQSLRRLYSNFEKMSPLRIGSSDLLIRKRACYH